MIRARRGWSTASSRAIRSRTTRCPFSTPCTSITKHSTRTPTTLPAWNRFIEGSASNAMQTSFPPSKVGLPSYLDQKAGSYIHLPNVDFGPYSDFTRGYPGFGNYSVGTIRAELAKYIGTHSLRFGVDLRENWRATNGPGNTSGNFAFGNSYVRQAQNTTNAASI